MDLLNEKYRLRNACIVWAALDVVHLVLSKTAVQFQPDYAGPQPVWTKLFLLTEAIWVILAACLAISVGAKSILDRSIADKDRTGFGLFVVLFAIYLLAYR